jgi:hypothetical protein
LIKIGLENAAAWHGCRTVEHRFVLKDAFGGYVFGSYKWLNEEHKNYLEVSPVVCMVGRVQYNSGDESFAAAEKYMTN